jgi:putative endonuclease
MDRQYYVYILANKPYGTLYVGITNDLVRRVWEHRNDVVGHRDWKVNLIQKKNPAWKDLYDKIRS